MKYTTLGNTGIRVSRICVGCMSYGKPSEDFHLWTLNEDDTRAMVGHALELGVNFFDTANGYSHGTSEEFLGKALRRLGTDYLDLYQIHRFDYDTPMEETMETLDSLVRAGKVRALGASAMYGYQFHNLQLCAEKNGWSMFQTMQNHYNLIYREDERELIPVCRQYGVSLIPYSPLAGGHLSHRGWETDSLRSKTDTNIRHKYDRAKENDLQIIDRVAELSERKGVSMTEIALAWHFAKGVAAPIVGATKVSHFDQAVRAVDMELSAEEVAFLEEPYAPHSVVGPR